MMVLALHWRPTVSLGHQAKESTNKALERCLQRAEPPAETRFF